MADQNTLWSPGPEPALMASRHTERGEIYFPPLEPSSVLASACTPVPLDGSGTVYSYTVIHPGAKSGLAPYALGYVDLPGPVRVFGRLRGKSRPIIGDRYRAVPDDEFGYVFQYADEGAGA